MDTENIENLNNGRDNKGKFKEGHSGFKQRGTGDFSKDFGRFIKKMAKKEGMTVSQTREMLFKVAWAEAKNGNYNFFRDIMDRYYGKALQTVDVKDDRDKEELREQREELNNLINDVKTKNTTNTTEGKTDMPIPAKPIST